jgi:hypothetical protein
MATFQGAVIREQGVTFGVAVVKSGVLQDSGRRDDAVRSFSAAFGGVPTVLMAQDVRGRARYYGRDDLARFLANQPLAAIPWRAWRITGG